MNSTRAERRREARASTPSRSSPACRAHALDDARDQRLDELHHVAVVGVRLVELEHRELGIVRPVDPLVPEVVPDLVDPLEPADQQPLEIQLVRDAQVERHVERVVVRHERPRRRAAVERLQDRRLDLEEAPPVEERRIEAISAGAELEDAPAPPDAPRDRRSAGGSADSGSANPP